MTQSSAGTTTDTFAANVVQYLSPDGRKDHCFMDLPERLREKYETLTDCGCQIAGEVLTTGEVSVTIEHSEGDYAMYVVPNGPEVRDAVELMVEQFDREKFEAWLREMSE